MKILWINTVILLSYLKLDLHVLNVVSCHFPPTYRDILRVLYRFTKSQNIELLENKFARIKMSEICLPLSAVGTSVNYITFFDAVFTCIKQGPFLSSVYTIF